MNLSLPQTLVKDLAKNLGKNLTKNLTKNLQNLANNLVKNNLRYLFLIFAPCAPELLVCELNIGFLVNNCIMCKLETSRILISGKQMMNSIFEHDRLNTTSQLRKT